MRIKGNSKRSINLSHKILRYFHSSYKRYLYYCKIDLRCNCKKFITIVKIYIYIYFNSIALFQSLPIIYIYNTRKKKKSFLWLNLYYFLLIPLHYKCLDLNIPIFEHLSIRFFVSSHAKVGAFKVRALFIREFAKENKMDGFYSCY